MPTEPDDLIRGARKRWQKCAEAENGQRKRILAAKLFRAGEQWTPALKVQREGGHAIAGMPAVPPRPCLVVDRLSQPVRQTSNIIKNAQFSFDVMPNGGGADDDTAEIFKGYMRRVHNNARGESPVEWAADGAIEAGLGWFRLRTEYVHETWDGDPNDPEVFDQEIREERITNSLTVYCDPSSSHPTRRTAQFMFITEDLDKDEFTRQFPDADVRGLEEFMATGDMDGWVTNDIIRIAEYWRIEYQERTFCELVDGRIIEKSDGVKVPKDQVKRERVMQVPQVKCDKINACESLKSYKWVGSRIPIFPILGEELNVDGKPVLRGIIDEGMDAQRMVNYTYSGAMEIFALSPKSPYIVAEGQIDAYKAMWQTANIYNYSALYYTPQSIAGDLVPPPQRQTYEAPIQAAVELMRTSEEAIKATTSTGDASLGNSNPNERSGKALQALQAQSELSNSNYPDNVRRALIAAAEEMAIVIPKITRPGQIIQILGQDDEPKQVMVGKPFQQGPNGVPQASPPDITPEIAKDPKSLHKFYDLNHGRYAVTVTVGKASSTKREEGAMALGALIPHLPPEMAAVATPDYVEQLSFPGSHKIAEKLRKTLPPQLQDQDQQAQVPPQVQAQMQAMQQQLQQAHQIIQTDQVKQQATIQSAKVKADADIQIAHLNNAARIEIARIGAAKEAMNEQAEDAEERLATGLQLTHEHVQGQLDRAHEAQMAQMGHAQALEQGAQSAAVGQQSQQADQQHQAAMAQQAQDAQQTQGQE
jgi:hypothetical protein